MQNVERNHARMVKHSKDASIIYKHLELSTKKNIVMKTSNGTF